MKIPNQKILNELAINTLAKMLEIVEENPEYLDQGYKETIRDFEVTKIAEIIKNKIAKA